MSSVFLTGRVHLALCRGKANAIGRSSKTVREFLEKNHKDDMTRDESIKVTVKSLLEVVQTGAKNIEISVMEGYGKVTVSTRNVCSSPPRLHTWPQNLDLAQIEAIVQEIEQEKEAGKTKEASDFLNPTHNHVLCRRGEEALEVGGHRCRPSRHVNPGRGCARFIRAIVL